MAIPKKGSRKIIVEEEEYRWLIRRKATYSQTDYGIGFISVAIEHAQEKGTVLVVYTNKPHPKDWATNEVDPVTLSDINKWILEAIDMGGLQNKMGHNLSTEFRNNVSMHNKASQNRTFGAGLAVARLCLRRYVNLNL